MVLSQCNYIVLDEADRMLDLGFEPKIQQVMSYLPSTNIKPTEIDLKDGESITKYRQTVMFSATMPPRVESLALQYLRNPVRIEINIGGLRVADTVEQRIEWVNSRSKSSHLLHILQEYYGPILIFCDRKNDVENLVQFLESKNHLIKNHRITSYHTGKSQDQRDIALEGFRNGRYSILVATDIAARGVDVKGINVVINYTMPEGENPIQTYTHRVGRTGRAGKKGIAISFLTLEDIHIFYSLKKLLEECNVPVPKQLLEHPASSIDPRYLEKGTDLNKLTTESF
uniref:RNA helicase n=1 Tax=Lygus hesperus TaxID=30085 RepID=A0A0A9ZHW1_LYGHE